MRKCLWLAAAVATALFVTTTHAQVKVETVLDGLNNPCGVAVQPDTGTVFVADSGAGRVVRVVDGKAEVVISGFPLDVYGKGPMYNVGPLGLAFLNKDTLVIGGGGNPDGEELLRVYKVPATGEKPITADKMAASFKLAGENVGSDNEVKGEGNFYAVVATENAVFVTSNGDDTKGWVAKGAVKDGTVTAYERSIATKEAVGVDAPVAITKHPRRGFLAVGQMGEITVPNDSLLCFYNPNNGKLRASLKTGLFDITGLAYSPNNQLFATDFAWMDTKEGGLFQLIRRQEGGMQAVKANKVVSLDKPTALAFGTDGALYITVIGTGDKNPGKLVKIAPGL